MSVLQSLINPRLPRPFVPMTIGRYSTQAERIDDQGRRYSRRGNLIEEDILSLDREFLRRRKSFTNHLLMSKRKKLFGSKNDFRRFMADHSYEHPAAWIQSEFAEVGRYVLEHMSGRDFDTEARRFYEGGQTRSGRARSLARKRGVSASFVKRETERLKSNSSIGKLDELLRDIDARMPPAQEPQGRESMLLWENNEDGNEETSWLDVLLKTITSFATSSWTTVADAVTALASAVGRGIKTTFATFAKWIGGHLTRFFLSDIWSEILKPSLAALSITFFWIIASKTTGVLKAICHVAVIFISGLWMAQVQDSFILMIALGWTLGWNIGSLLRQWIESGYPDEPTLYLYVPPGYQVPQGDEDRIDPKELKKMNSVPANRWLKAIELADIVKGLSSFNIATRTVETLEKYVTRLVHWAYQTYYGYPIGKKELHATFKRIDTWMNDTSEAEIAFVTNRSRETAFKVIDLKREGDNLMKEVGLREVREFVQPFIIRHGMMTRLYATARGLVVGTKARPRPTGLILMGKPGTGKDRFLSELSEALVKELYVKEGEKFEPEAYVHMIKSTKEKYPGDKYCGQPIARWMDAFISNDPDLLTEEVMTLMPWVEETPTPLIASDIDNKGEIFANSDFVFVSTNYMIPFSNANTKLTDPSALGRRFMFLETVNEPFALQEHLGEVRFVMYEVVQHGQNGPLEWSCLLQDFVNRRPGDPFDQRMLHATYSKRDVIRAMVKSYHRNKREFEMRDRPPEVIEEDLARPRQGQTQRGRQDFALFWTQERPANRPRNPRDDDEEPIIPGQDGQGANQTTLAKYYYFHYEDFVIEVGTDEAQALYNSCAYLICAGFYAVGYFTQYSYDVISEKEIVLSRSEKRECDDVFDEPLMSAISHPLKFPDQEDLQKSWRYWKGATSFNRMFGKDEELGNVAQTFARPATCMLSHALLFIGRHNRKTSIFVDHTFDSDYAKAFVESFYKSWQPLRGISDLHRYILACEEQLHNHQGTVARRTRQLIDSYRYEVLRRYIAEGKDIVYPETEFGELMKDRDAEALREEGDLLSGSAATGFVIMPTGDIEQDSQGIFNKLKSIYHSIANTPWNVKFSGFWSDNAVERFWSMCPLYRYQLEEEREHLSEWFDYDDATRIISVPHDFRWDSVSYRPPVDFKLEIALLGVGLLVAAIYGVYKLFGFKDAQVPESDTGKRANREIIVSRRAGKTVRPLAKEAQGTLVGTQNAAEGNMIRIEMLMEKGWCITRGLMLDSDHVAFNRHNVTQNEWNVEGGVYTVTEIKLYKNGICLSYFQGVDAHIAIDSEIDLGVIYIGYLGKPDTQPQKKIKKFQGVKEIWHLLLPTEHAPDPIPKLTMLFDERDHRVVNKTARFNVVPVHQSEWYTAPGGLREIRQRYAYKTEKGHCGTVAVIDCDHPTLGGIIIGMHSAVDKWDNGTKFLVPINRPIIMAMFDELLHMQEGQSLLMQAIDNSTAFEKIGYTSSDRQSHVNDKNKIKPTPFQGNKELGIPPRWHEPNTQPAILKATSEYSPLAECIKTYERRPSRNLTQAEIDFVVACHEHTKLRIDPSFVIELSDVCLMKHHRPTGRASSGHPWNTAMYNKMTKNDIIKITDGPSGYISHTYDPIFLEECEKFLRNCEKKIWDSGSNFATMSLKAETRAKGKEHQPRSFNVHSAMMYIFGSMLWLPLNCADKSYPYDSVSTFGLDVHGPMPERCFNRMEKKPNSSFDGDFKKYDRHLHEMITALCKRFDIKDLTGFWKNSKFVFNGIPYDIDLTWFIGQMFDWATRPPIVVNKLVLRPYKPFNLSGSWITGHLNKRSNDIHTQLGYRDAFVKLMQHEPRPEDFFADIIYRTHGDDIVILVWCDELLPYFNAVSFASYLLELGMVFTPAAKGNDLAPTLPFEDVSFLQRHCALVGDSFTGRATFRMPRKIDDILESLYWWEPGTQQFHEWTLSTMRSALDDLHHHGRETYMKYKEEFELICAEYDTEIRPPFKTYTEMYRERDLTSRVLTQDQRELLAKKVAVNKFDVFLPFTRDA